MRFTAIFAIWLAISAFGPSSFGQRTGGGGRLPESPGHIAFSADGSQLACSARDRIYVWRVATGELQQTIDTPARVGPLAWVPGRSQIAAGSSDGSIYLWNPQTGEPGQPIAINQGAIHDLAFADDGTRLLVACEVGDLDMGVLTVELWDVHQRRVLKTLAHAEQSLSGGIAFSPDQATVAFGINSFPGQSEVRRWCIESGEWERPFVLPEGRIKSLAYSPNGDEIVCGGWLDQGDGRAQGMVSRWNTTDAVQTHVEVFPTLRSMQVTFAPDGGSLVGGASLSTHGRELAGIVAKWTLGEQRAGWEVRVDSHGINGIAFSPDGKLLAFSCGGTQKRMSKLELVDPQSGEVTASLWPKVGSN